MPSSRKSPINLALDRVRLVARTTLPAPGRIVVLNGPSSAGKSSIARELQAVLSWSFLHVQMDVFRAMEPSDYFIKGQPETSALRVAALCRAVNATCAEYARHGQNVILDHVLSDQAWSYLAEDLIGLPVVLVGVRCPTEVLELRERNRADRPVGLAASQAQMHDGHHYDIEIDTSALSGEEGARQVAHWITEHSHAGAFQRLASRAAV